MFCAKKDTNLAVQACCLSMVLLKKHFVDFRSEMFGLLSFTHLDYFLQNFFSNKRERKIMGCFYLKETSCGMP